MLGVGGGGGFWTGVVCTGTIGTEGVDKGVVTMPVFFTIGSGLALRGGGDAGGWFVVGSGLIAGCADFIGLGGIIGELFGCGG